MKFISMLDEDLFLESVSGSSRSEVYSSMLNALSDYAELELDTAALTREMIEHEDSVGAMLPNLAMPHLRIAELHDLYIVIGLPENPAALGTDVVFMSLIGDGMSDVYLKMLSTLGRSLGKKENLDAFVAAAKAGRSAFWEYMRSCGMTLREVVSAEDVMSPVREVLRTDAPLSKAFDLFFSGHCRFLPVVDNEGRLAGELSAREVIKSFFPEYVFMMENLNFLNDFAVFNEIFHSEHSLPVSRYMNSEPAMATLDTPLIQLTLLLIKQGSGDVYIVDDDNKLQGVFKTDNVISKVLRG
ncbi:MAG: CBS domain-containing protein [Lentisphaerae bacterium]|nr:CBS domain-containing protein [Lentisphaerota bacterium]